MLKIDFVLQKIHDAYGVLSSATDFSPLNNSLNCALTSLVEALSINFTADEEVKILSHAIIHKTRKDLIGYLSCAEAEMEKYWADRLNQNDTISAKQLKEFWYWDNYVGLVEQEILHLPYTGYTSKTSAFNIAPDDSIAFVGSGALPLSAIIMHMKTNMRVTCIDSDPVACEKSRALIKKAGFSEGMDVVCIEGENFSYRKNPFIFIASLVPDKEAVLRQVSKSERQNYIGIRSAEGIHTLLYDPVNEHSEELSYCNFVDKTEPNPKIINTTLFYHSNPGWHIELENRRTKGIRYHKFGWGNLRTI